MPGTRNPQSPPGPRARLADFVKSSVDVLRDRTIVGQHLSNLTHGSREVLELRRGVRLLIERVLVPRISRIVGASSPAFTP